MKFNQLYFEIMKTEGTEHCETLFTLECNRILFTVDLFKSSIGYCNRHHCEFTDKYLCKYNTLCLDILKYTSGEIILWQSVG